MSDTQEDRSNTQDVIADICSNFSLTKEEKKNKLIGAFPDLSWKQIRRRMYRLGYRLSSLNRPDLDYVHREVEFLFGKDEINAKKLARNVPNTDLDNPFVVGTNHGREPKFMAINSPLVGALRPVSPAKDQLRNLLRIAQMSSVDCILLTGNIVWIDILRASNLKPYRAQSSGVMPNFEKFTYPPSIEEALGSLKQRQEESRIRFFTFKDRFDAVVEMLYGSFHNKEGSPIFTGPILISFGAVEEALSIWYTNERMHLGVTEEKERIKQHVRQLREDLKKAPTENAKRGIEEAIKDFKIYRSVWVSMTNTSEEFIIQTVRAMQGYIVQKLEAAIPHSRVVATGDAYLKLDGKVVQIYNGKASDSLNGRLAGKIRRATISRIKGLAGKKLPDIILGAGLNPFLTGNLVTYRAKKNRGERDDVHTSYIVQLPTCIDAEQYRRAKRTHVEAKDALMRLASHEDFDSGAFVFEWVSGIPRFEIYSSSYLTNEDIMSSDEKLAANLRERSMLYFLKEGCTHQGARFIAYYPLREERDGRWFKFHYQVVFDLLKAAGAPILGYYHDGDATQGYNYDVEKEVHPHWKSFENFLEEINKIDENTALSVEEKLAHTRRTFQLNAIYEGILQPQDQWNSYIEALKPHIPFFRGIIRRAYEAGLVVRGSQLAPLTYIRGNHNENTFKHGKVSVDEAEIIVRYLWSELLDNAPKQLLPLIKRYVRWGRVGTLGEAGGVLAVLPSELQDISEEDLLNQSDNFVYSLFMMHKQGTSKLADNMEPMRKAYNQRGTAESYEANVDFGINLAGDDHLGGFCVTRSAFHIKTGGQMFKNPFGDRHSFPMQNVFNVSFGLPKDGPHTGPLVLIPFNYPEIRKWAWDQYQINGKKLFRNAFTGHKSCRK